MPAPPLRTEVSGTYPNPSNAVARIGIGKLWDYVVGLLGATGNAADARTALGGVPTLAGAEVLTNKTLTNPVINGFTGDTSAINIGSGQIVKDTGGRVGFNCTPASTVQVDIKGAGAGTTTYTLRCRDSGDVSLFAVDDSGDAYVYAGKLLSTSANLQGYGLGAGGTVVQTTSKSTSVTLNTPTGVITTHDESLASLTSVFFVFNNSLLAATDRLYVHRKTGGTGSGAYRVWVDGVVAGGAVIGIRNETGAPLAQAVELGFEIRNGASA